MKAGIYKIESKDGKIYIGQTKNLSRRYIQHLSDLRKGKHKNKHLQFAYNKYKEDYFTFSVIAYCNVENLDKYEQACLDMLFTRYERNNVYNVSPIAESNKGIKRSKETCHKIGESKKGNTNMLGKHHTEETKAKISKAGKGRQLSEEHKAKVSAYHKGKQHRLGKTITEEHKSRIRKAVSGNANGAKTYIFVSPSGINTEIYNLTKFCRDNNLNYGCMLKVNNGTLPQHKGWRKAI